MAGWVADKFWLLIMMLQIDSENSATGIRNNNQFLYTYILILSLHGIFNFTQSFQNSITAKALNK